MEEMRISFKTEGAKDQPTFSTMENASASNALLAPRYLFSTNARCSCPAPDAAGRKACIQFVSGTEPPDSGWPRQVQGRAAIFEKD